MERYNQDLAIVHTKEMGDKASEGRAYGNLGIAHDCLGNFQQGIECQMQQLRIAEETGERVGEGRAYCNLGIAYRRHGDFKQALEFHEQCLLLFAEEFDDKAGKGRAYSNLGCENTISVISSKL